MARTIAKDHQQKRKAILATAAQFFADNGYDRSSMAQLADACGVSKALIYHYYASKDALLFDIIHTHLTQLLDSVEKADNPELPAKDRVRVLSKAILSAYRDADAEHKVQLEAMSSLALHQREQLANIQRRLVELMSDSLRQTSPETFGRSPEKLKPVTMSVFGMLNWFYMWHSPGKGLSREDYGDLVADLILEGISGLGAAQNTENG